MYKCIYVQNSVRDGNGCYLDLKRGIPLTFIPYPQQLILADIPRQSKVKYTRKSHSSLQGIHARVLYIFSFYSILLLLLLLLLLLYSIPIPIYYTHPLIHFYIFIIYYFIHFRGLHFNHQKYNTCDVFPTEDSFWSYFLFI